MMLKSRVGLPQSIAVAMITAVAFSAVSSAAFAGSRADSTAEANTVSLYERLGGLPAISLVVSDFMDVFTKDPVILSNPEVRARKTGEAVPYITYQVTTVVCEAAGGPCRYTGASLRDAHDGLNISPSEWDRMAEILIETLQRHNVPEQEQQDLLAILGPTRDDIVAAD
jgi:hemoglobin